AGAGEVEEAAERLAVALLLADEEVHGGGVVGVADRLGEARGGCAEVAAVGGLAELPGLQGAGDGGEFAGGDARAAFPRQWRGPVRVVTEQGGPLAPGADAGRGITL